MYILNTSYQRKTVLLYLLDVPLLPSYNNNFVGNERRSFKRKRSVDDDQLTFTTHTQFLQNNILRDYKFCFALVEIAIFLHNTIQSTIILYSIMVIISLVRLLLAESNTWP